MSRAEKVRDKLKVDRRDQKDESRDCQARKVVWQRMHARMAELKAQHDEAVDAQNVRRALACRMALKALQARMEKVWT